LKPSLVEHYLVNSALLITHCDRKTTIGLGGKEWQKIIKNLT
jgi:hypothetical protein